MKKYYCHGCKQALPADRFGRNKTTKTGYQSRCKECFKNYKSGTRVKQSLQFEGVIRKDKLDRSQLLKQIDFIRKRENNPETTSDYDYSFLNTNKKFLE